MMREPHKSDEPTAYRDPGPTIISGGSLPPPHGLDRCVTTIVAAVMSLRDCGEEDQHIVQAMAAVTAFGPLEVIKRMEAASKAD